MVELVRASSKILNAGPRDRLWLVGDGPWRNKIYSELKQLGLQYAAFMPGSFDHVEELVQASDVYVMPSSLDGMEHYLASAIAAGLPVVLADTPDARGFAGACFEEMHSFDKDDPEQMASRIESLLANLPHANQQALRIRSQMVASRPEGETIERYSMLFERLVSRSLPEAAGATG